MTSHFDGWSKDKHPIIVMCARAFVPHLSGFLHLIREIRSRNIIDFKIEGTESAWLGFYENELFAFDWAKRTGIVNMDGLREFAAGASDEPVDGAVDVDSAVLEAIAASMSGPIAEASVEADDDNAAGAAREPEFQFILRVWMPCWLIHHVTPQGLFKTAVGGDLQALKSLRQIDQLVVLHPKLTQVMHEIERGPSSVLADVMTSSTKELEKELTPRRAKVFYAAVIGLIADVVGTPLRIGQLRDLLDSVARDSSEMDLPDHDLQPRPDAFRKAVRREQEAIRKIYQPQAD